jgi:hypothetical protein
MTAIRTVAVGFPRGRLALLGLIPGLIVVDIVNGVMGGGGALTGLPSPAEVVRGGILLWALVVTLRVVNPALRRLQLWVISLAVLGSAGLTVTYFQTGSFQDLFGNVSQLSKVLYGPALVLLLVVLIRRYRIDTLEVVDAVAWVAGVAGASIVALEVTGLGRSTYGAYEVGGKGLFISQNDIGVAMGIGLIAAVHLMFRIRRRRYAVVSALGFIGMLVLGTRAAMLAAFLIPLVMLLFHRSSLIAGRRRLFAGVFVLMGVLAGLAVAGAWQYQNLQAERFQQVKLQRLADNPFVRGIRVIAAVRYVSQRPAFAGIAGEGMVSYGRGVARELQVNADYVLAEVDWMDMFGAYGILFALAIHVYYFAFLVRTRGLRENGGRAFQYTAAFAISWFLLHSMIAGHAMGGTIPAGTLAPLLSVIWVESRKPSSEVAGD